MQSHTWDAQHAEYFLEDLHGFPSDRWEKSKNSLMTSQQNVNGIKNIIKLSEDINRTLQMKNRILNIEVKEGNHIKIIKITTCISKWH